MKKNIYCIKIRRGVEHGYKNGNDCFGWHLHLSSGNWVFEEKSINYTEFSGSYGSWNPGNLYYK